MRCFPVLNFGSPPRRKAFTRLGVALVCLLTAGCAIAPGGGPSSRAVWHANSSALGNSKIAVVDVTDDIARGLINASHASQFSDTLGPGKPIGAIIGAGDVLDIAIWEAPPAALFGMTGGDPRLTSSSSTARGTSIPEQMVNAEGQVIVPFVGAVNAVGRTPTDIEREIARRLIGKAHQPQVIVRVVRNVSSAVTVVGDVAGSTRVPLTTKGERLLDVLASVGGVKQPLNKTSIQITRGAKVVSMPLDTVIRDPRQNIILRPDDVVAALFQPYSFVALGATGRNEELPFEATGITLSQALGRVSGLQDARANVKGVFIFRFEDPAALPPATAQAAHLTPDGKVPVIYRVDFSDPASLFISQSFPIRNKDVLYVSNAPLADIQKFISVLYSAVLPVATAAAVAP